jgi:hypothetical protein
VTILPRFFDLESILTSGLGGRQGSDDSQTCSPTDPFESRAAKQNDSSPSDRDSRRAAIRIFLFPAAKPLRMAGPGDFFKANFDLLFGDPADSLFIFSVFYSWQAIRNRPKRNPFRRRYDRSWARRRVPDADFRAYETRPESHRARRLGIAGRSARAPR